MNGGALAPGLLLASLGLTLSFAASKRVAASGLLLLLATALAAANLASGSSLGDLAAAGCWIGVLANAICMHLKRPLGYVVAAALCIWAGLTIATSGQFSELVPALPWALLCLPGAWLVSNGRAVVVKVAGSWLAAVAILSLGLNMVPTLGFEPDHMK